MDVGGRWSYKTILRVHAETNPVPSKIGRNQLSDGRGATKGCNLLKRGKVIAKHIQTQWNRRRNLRRLRAEGRSHGAVPNNLASRANESSVNRGRRVKPSLAQCSGAVLEEIRIVVMKNGQQEKMHLQQHQGAGKGGPPVTIPEVTSHRQ